MDVMQKAIAIPMIDTGDGNPQFLLVHDKRYREWTFVTGGCRLRETYNPLKCALRELEEETRGIVVIKKGKYNYFRFPAEFSGVEKAIYHVYIFHIRMATDELTYIVEKFQEEKQKMDTNQVSFRKNYDENDNLKFVNMEELKKCSTLWKLISDNVLNNKEFHVAIKGHRIRDFHII